MKWWSKELYGDESNVVDKVFGDNFGTKHPLKAYEYSDGYSDERPAPYDVHITVFHTGRIKLFDTMEERDTFVSNNSFETVKGGKKWTWLKKKLKTLFILLRNR